MEIRKLTMKDYYAVSRLWLHAELPFKPKGRDSMEAMSAQMEVEPDFFLGAFENDDLIGTVIVTFDRRRGWINRLAVDPNHRRRGAAKALIAESEKILRNRGVRVFCCLIEGHNEPSRELFKKCGYIEHRDVAYFSKRDSDRV